MGKIEKKLSLSLILSLFFLSGGLAQQDSSRTDLSTYFSPQKILAFSDFLFLERDYLRSASEYQRYLFLGISEGKHQVLYRIGQCYFSASRPEQAVDYFRKAAEFKTNQTFQDSAMLALITALFFTRQYTEFQQTMEFFQDRNVSIDMKTRLAILQAGYYMREKQWEKAHSFLSGSKDRPGIKEYDPSFMTMTRFAERGINLPRKSPLLAGVMSGIIPGTGKMYAGRWGDGLFSLILISGTSWLAYEGFRDSGISSFRGWFFGGLAFFFHSGNVYGSVKAAQFTNRLMEETLTHDVETHFSVAICF